jgi:pSer/pThr/pTyr-binding forkhead associated (FHA) protein
MEFNISIFVGGTLKGNKQVTTPCVIGRSKEVNLTVAHPVMSRKHCELAEEDGKIYLRDNSSLNGTIFNGEYIEKPVAIQIGEEFSVGELTFKLLPLVPEIPKQADHSPLAISSSKEDSAAMTILEPRSTNQSSVANPIPAAPAVSDAAEKNPAENPAEKTAENSPQQKKSAKKISPKDVRIVT